MFVLISCCRTHIFKILRTGKLHAPGFPIHRVDIIWRAIRLPSFPPALRLGFLGLVSTTQFFWDCRSLRSSYCAPRSTRTDHHLHCRIACANNATPASTHALSTTPPPTCLLLLWERYTCLIELRPFTHHTCYAHAPRLLPAAAHHYLQPRSCLPCSLPFFPAPPFLRSATCYLLCATAAHSPVAPFTCNDPLVSTFSPVPRCRFRGCTFPRHARTLLTRCFVYYGCGFFTCVHYLPPRLDIHTVLLFRSLHRFYHTCGSVYAYLGNATVLRYVDFTFSLPTTAARLRASSTLPPHAQHTSACRSHLPAFLTVTYHHLYLLLFFMPAIWEEFVGVSLTFALFRFATYGSPLFPLLDSTY